MKQLTVLVDLLRVAEILGQGSVYLGRLQRNNKTILNKTFSSCSVQGSRNTHKDTGHHGTTFIHSFIANLFPKLSHNNDIQYWEKAYNL